MVRIVDTLEEFWRDILRIFWRDEKVRKTPCPQRDREGINTAMNADEDKTLYELLGGESGLRRLVERFYHHMDTLPEAKPIRALHPEDLSTSIDRLFWFLSGWSGGPSLFHEKRGHPMLRARHMPFAIGKSERDQWMICMLKAVEDMGIVDPLKSDLIGAFLRVADHMRNQDRE